MGRGLSRQEILQEAIELILAREGEPQTWTAVGRQNGGESGDVEDREESSREMTLNCMVTLQA